MKPNAFLDMGITIGKVNASDQLTGDEKLLVMALVGLWCLVVRCAVLCCGAVWCAVLVMA